MENNTDIEHQNESITNNNIVANIVANADSNDKKSTDNIIEIVKKLNFDLEIKPFKDIYDLLEKSIYEDPPITLKEGYLIK